jgi:hypothetical protein
MSKPLILYGNSTRTCLWKKEVFKPRGFLAKKKPRFYYMPAKGGPAY